MSHPGRWATAALLLAVTTVLYTDASRYMVPVGEKYVNMIAPGSVDIHASFQAARAYLRGVNPYRNYEPDLQAGIIPAELGGVRRTYVYPPSHLLLYVPLALASHGDPRTAAQMQFWVNLACLALLAWLSWLLLRALDPTAFASVAWPLAVLMVLALNPGVAFCLERGQSEIMQAAMAWGAVVLALRGRWATAMFLATACALAKGYGALFAAGLGFAGLRPRTWKATLLGTVAALVVLLAPVARYLPEAAETVRLRGALFWDAWTNHAFKNAVYPWAPRAADAGAKVIALAALAASVAAWVRLRRALARPEEDARERALWMTLFACASLGTMIGLSSLSFCYNLILVLPGAVVVALGHEAAVQVLRLPRAGAHLLGAAMAATLVLLLALRMGSRQVSTAAYGLLLLIAVTATLAAWAWRRRATA